MVLLKQLKDLWVQCESCSYQGARFAGKFILGSLAKERLECPRCRKAACYVKVNSLKHVKDIRQMVKNSWFKPVINYDADIRFVAYCSADNIKKVEIVMTEILEESWRIWCVYASHGRNNRNFIQWIKLEPNEAINYKDFEKVESPSAEVAGRSVDTVLYKC